MLTDKEKKLNMISSCLWFGLFSFLWSHCWVILNSAQLEISLTHKVHMYLDSIEYLSVCPLVRIGTPTPIPTSECVPPGATWGEGHIRLRVRGWEGCPNSDDWRKGLALCLLCGLICVLLHHENSILLYQEKLRSRNSRRHFCSTLF
jgi:hypothetical protein